MKESELNNLVEKCGQDYVSRRLRIQGAGGSRKILNKELEYMAVVRAAGIGPTNSESPET